MLRYCTTQLGYVPKIWLFGSRLHDEVRGGDFDLLIEVQSKLPLLEELLHYRSTQLCLQYALSQVLERKVDLLVSTQGQESGPWQRLAKAQGVLLHDAVY